MRLTSLFLFSSLVGCGTGAAVADDDGTADSASPEDCVEHAPPTVQCGESVCEGDTPLCCAKYDADQGGVYVTFGCADAAASCAALDPDPSIDDFTLASECEDATDCAAGQVCCTQYNQGRGYDEGTTCEVDCDQLMYGSQLCTEDCECLGDQTCTTDRQPYDVCH